MIGGAVGGTGADGTDTGYHWRQNQKKSKSRNMISEKSMATIKRKQ